VPSLRLYTAMQVAIAAEELRQAAGSDAERFPLHQVINMLSDEIRLLRERGFSDQRIADLFTGFDIEATSEDIARNSTAGRD